MIVVCSSEFEVMKSNGAGCGMNSNGVNFSIHKDGMDVKQLPKREAEWEISTQRSQDLTTRISFWLPCNFLDIFPYIWM